MIILFVGLYIITNSIEVVQEPVKIYTFLPDTMQPIVRNERKEGDKAPDVEEWEFAQTYNDKLTCN